MRCSRCRSPSAGAKKPRDNPKADLRRYFMLAHGSHLVDTARFLAGDLVEVSARLTAKIRRLLLVRRRRLCQWRRRPSRPDGRGAHGLARGLAALRRERQHHREDLQPLVLQVFRRRDLLTRSDATWRRPLGADGHFYRRQLEGFADTILDGAPMRGADIADGVASVRAMAAIAQSVAQRPRRSLADVQGPV